MMQKVVVGLLVLTVFGAVGMGVYDAFQSDEPAGATELLALETEQTDSVENTMNASPTPATQTPTVPAPVAQATVAAEPGQPIQQQQALNQIGEPWYDSGMIAAFDDNGMSLTTMSGEIYVELGPPMFWQEQPVSLEVGETVSVNGFYNGDQYHAVSVNKADGTQLIVRTEDGLPMWSSGAQNGHDAQGQQGQGGQAQLEPVDWITFEGVVTETQANILTMETLNGQTFDLQLGQKNFVDSQGITFAAGDKITVVGYWQGEQFKAGEITKTVTGERLMLLDPNGRPLWGGPGRSGEQGQSQGSGGGNGNGQSQGNGGGNGQSSDRGNGGNGNGGNGNGYRGGRDS